MYPIHPSSPSSHQSISPIDWSISPNQSWGYGIAGAHFWRFPEKYFQNQLTLYTYKNAFVSLQNSGDFQKSICEISSLCSLTKNAFVPLQNYLWQAYKIKHFWWAVGSIPTPAMLKVTQRHTTVSAGSAAGRALERESECLSKREILKEFPLLRAHFAKHFL